MRVYLSYSTWYSFFCHSFVILSYHFPSFYIIMPFRKLLAYYLHQMIYMSQLSKLRRECTNIRSHTSKYLLSTYTEHKTFLSKLRFINIFFFSTSGVLLLDGNLCSNRIQVWSMMSFPPLRPIATTLPKLDFVINSLLFEGYRSWASRIRAAWTG